LSRKRTERPGRRERNETKQFKRKQQPSGRGLLGETLQPLVPKTRGQEDLIEAINTSDITICDGPAGTGKTYISFGSALHARLNDPDIRRIVIVRPTIPAGEDDPIGFLPGDLNDKMAPFVAPLMKDSAAQLIHSDYHMDAVEYQEFLNDLVARLDIEIAPLAFIRGRTFNNSFVILDEAQNCTKNDFKLFLTRIGKNSRVIVEGDSSQSDREDGYLTQLQGLLEGMERVSVVKLHSCDIIRNELIAEILRRLP
jgi:phosphate starvation-inducible PhoH-like protein